jgi:hypothetical protein
MSYRGMRYIAIRKTGLPITVLMAASRVDPRPETYHSRLQSLCHAAVGAWGLLCTGAARPTSRGRARQVARRQIGSMGQADDMSERVVRADRAAGLACGASAQAQP